MVLVEHEISPGDDRAATYLAARGFRLDWRRPFAGDGLDDLMNGDTADIAGTIIYGGGQCATDSFPYLAEESRWVEFCIAQSLPTLGICLGGQIVAHTLGAAVGPHPEGLHEFGYYTVSPTAAGKPEFLSGDLVVVQAHFHEFQLPHGAKLLATSDGFERQAFLYGSNAYAIQFHPEVTIDGMRRWQDAPWAPWGAPGVQTREEQDALGSKHDPRQHLWFTAFLDGLFGVASDRVE